MRFLANENFPLDSVLALSESGHDVAWVRTEAPGSSDAEVLARAISEERILITFDKDFGELAFHSRLPALYGIILFRVTIPSPEYLARLVANAINSYSDWAGHFAVIENSRIRSLPGVD